MGPRIDLIFFDATSGHRSAAQAIRGALASTHPEVEARMLNLVELLAGHRVLQGIANAGIDFFNWGMREELSLLPEQQIAFFQAFQRALPDAAAEAVAAFWRAREVDAVVSVIPICNRFLERSLHRAKPGCPYVILPVDMEEGRPRYWFEPDADARWLCPSPRLLSQAAAAGVPEDRLEAISGMPVDPSFYAVPALERAAELSAVGLDPARPTVLVSFGGQGSVFVDACARGLCALGDTINVIFLCGRDAKSRERVSRMETPYRKLALGFSPEAPARWYALADVIVGKPGSMTLTEAIVTRRPLVAVESKTLAVVQRGNEAWIREAGVGEVARLEEVAPAVRRLLDRPEARAAIERHWHRGVFEIADRIVQIAGGEPC